MNELRDINKNNKNVLNNITKFMDLISKIESTLTEKTEIKITEIETLKIKLEENMELMHRISVNLT